MSALPLISGLCVLAAMLAAPCFALLRRSRP